MTLLFALLGCVPTVDLEVLGPAGDGSTGEQTMAVVTTTDFQVGALSTVDLATWEVADALAPTSPDPTVHATGGLILQLNGAGSDYVRVYEPGLWRAPLAEFTLDRGANPHDAVEVDGELWLSLYGRPRLEVWRPQGERIGEVSLEHHADADGLPEASSMLWTGEALLVALERFDRDADWSPGEGRVVAIDPGSRAEVEVWSTGPSPSLHDHPAEPGTVLVLTGSYRPTGDGFAPRLDGGLSVLEPATGRLEVALTEAELGVGITGYAEVPSGHAVLLLDRGDRTYGLRCLDWNTGDLSEELPTTEWWAWAEPSDAGQVWVAARGGVTEGGLRVFDPVACEEVTPRLIPTALPPYRLALY